MPALGGVSQITADTRYGAMEWNPPLGRKKKRKSISTVKYRTAAAAAAAAAAGQRRRRQQRGGGGEIVQRMLDSEGIHAVHERYRTAG